MKNLLSLSEIFSRENNFLGMSLANITFTKFFSLFPHNCLQKFRQINFLN